MIDLKIIEKNPDLVRQNLENRQQDSSVVDSILSLNQKRKSLIFSSEQKQAQIKDLSQQIGKNKDNQTVVASLKSQVEVLKDAQSTEQVSLDFIQEELDQLLLNLPNVLSEDVKIGKSEDDNSVLLTYSPKSTLACAPKDHVTLGEQLGMLSFEDAVKITGARFVVYRKELAQLERALINFMIDHHLNKGYEEIIPPFIAKESSLVGTGNLPKFKDQLFKIEGQDWYLIPTAEVPLTNLVREEILSVDNLEQKMVAYTPCFRSEAGAHGKDIKGLIRLHQFNKVEMVRISHPKNSKQAHQEMIQSALEILQKLELPHRAVQLCSADTGFASTHTVDLEVWVPSQNKYREISSISNCGDFQARRANIRFKEQNKVYFAHTLNGSGLAVGRTVVAIMENYQQSDGTIKVPDVLVPYMRGLTVIGKGK